MTLQRRLTLFFVLIVILPLAVAGFVVQRVVVGEVARRADMSLRPALNASTALYNDRTDAIDERVRASLGFSTEEFSRFATLLQEEKATGVSNYLRARLLQSSNLDFLLAYDNEGQVLAYETRAGDFVPGFELPTADEVAASGNGIGRGFNHAPPIPVVGRFGEVGSILGGFWLDEDLLSAASQGSVVLSITDGREIIASTAALDGPVPVDISYGESFGADIDGDSKGRAAELDGDMAIVASYPTGPLNSLSQRVILSMLGLLLLALVGTTLLANALARFITQPLEEVAEGARSIAEGRFDQRIDIHSKDEVGRLAAAFNDMSDRLEETITELSSSRNQLHRSVRRVGETLRSTHDMRQMLEAILNMAVDSVHADGGVLWRFTPTREDLYPSNIVSIPSSELDRVRVGEGVVGLVAERATNIVLPARSGGPRSAVGEPGVPVVIAVPLYNQDRVGGVLSLYRREAERPFSREDVDTAVFLAEQGAVAVENVQLHEEARRLSLMDGLTGVWNRRFFQMQFRQVLATAARFTRPFSVLMLDLDHFKQVNDTYGHQRGDAILVEFAQRVSRTLREVDTFARYGGEEFICLLSETDIRGALTTAEKICDVIRSEPFGAQGEEPITITVSGGVAAHPDHGDSFQTLVEAADRALYRAKESGRDRVVVADVPGSQLKLAR